MESNATVNIPLKDYTSVQSFSMSIPHPEKNCGMKQTICAMNPRCADPKSPNKPGWKSHTRPVFSSAVLADETGPPASRCVKRCSQRPICHQIGAKENRWIEIERPAEYQCLLKQEQEANWQRAAEYNMVMDQMIRKKSEKLKEFQKNVKSRVKQLEKRKQDALIRKIHRAVELERSVARNTAFLAQSSVPNAEVMLTGRNDMIIKRRDMRLPNTATEPEAANSKVVMSLIASERKIKKVAREKLVSKQLAATENTMLLYGRDGQDAESAEAKDPLPSVTDEGIIAGIADMELNTEEMDEQLPMSNKGEAARLPNVTPSQSEEIRKQETRQRALLRRLYMDMERDQVKEYRKQQEHQRHINNIKKAKEEERRRQELLERQAACSPPPVTFSQSPDQHAKRRLAMVQKETENKRYMKALRSLLREKIERSAADLPLLCACADSLWDTDPDLCANNCPFYKNPKGYERAIQTLLSSCEVKD